MIKTIPVDPIAYLRGLKSKFPEDLYGMRVDEENGQITYEVWGKESGFLFKVYDDITEHKAKLLVELITLLNNEAKTVLDKSEDLRIYALAILHGWKIRRIKHPFDGYRWGKGPFVYPVKGTQFPPEIPFQVRLALKDQPHG